MNAQSMKLIQIIVGARILASYASLSVAQDRKTEQAIKHRRPSSPLVAGRFEFTAEGLI